VTGGMAVLVWGRPRFTADIDIVVEIEQSQGDKLRKALLALGQAGYLDEGALNKAIANKGEFNFIDGTTGLKVDFWVLADNPFDLSRLKRRRAKKILGEDIYFSSPEDLILIKLKWQKESPSSRHMEDAESILKISGGEIDFDYLRKWAKKLAVLGILKKLESKL